MFDKLIDFFIDIIKIFQFTYVIDAYQAGVRLRFGKFSKVLYPGLHFILPFYIDKVISENAVLETMRLDPQSLTTKDNHQVVVSSVITFRIADIKTFLLDVEGRNNVIEDSGYGVTSQFIMSHTYQELTGMPDLGNELSKSIRRQAKKYGVDIISVQVADFAKCKSFRLINNGKSIQLAQ